MRGDPRAGSGEPDTGVIPKPVPTRYTDFTVHLDATSPVA